MLKTALLSLTGILFFVWPIPHTITIREISLILSLIISGYLIYKNRVSCVGPLIRMKTFIELYALFIAWMLIVAVFISPDSSWTLREIESQWLWTSLTLILGICLVLLANGKTFDISKIFSVLFFALFSHVFIISADGIYTVINDLRVNEFQGLTFSTRGVNGLTRSPIDASVISVFLLGMVFTEIIFRGFYGRKYLNAGNSVLALAFAISFLCSILCGLRNIVELFFILICCVTLLFAHDNKFSRRKSLLIPVLLFSLMAGFFFFKSDPRWATLGKSMALARSTEYKWDIKPEELKNGGYAIAVGGEIVSVSNYFRFEKYELAIKTVAENPLGVGFGRNALGKSVEGIYKNAKNLNSDSSMLDFFVGTGIFGGVLWILFLANILWLAVSTFIKQKSYFAFWLILVIVAFSARMTVDSMGKDHLLQEFMFTAGLLYMLLRVEGSRLGGLQQGH